MSIGSILVGILLLAALGAAMIQPWWRPARRQVAKLTTDPHTEYEALVTAIRDLDFDYQAGVVTEADYRPLRDDLAARAVSQLQNLDRATTDEAGLEEQIEALRQGSGQTAVSALRTTRRPGVEIDLILRPNSEQACPNCNGPVEPEDRFCGTCGQMLVEEVTAA